MPSENILRLLVCTLAIFFGLLSIPFFISLIRIVIISLLRLKPLWVSDVSNENIEMSAEVQQTEAALYQLGLGRLGILQVRTRLTSNLLYEWHYFNADGSIYAEVVQINPKLPALVQFATRFSDDSFVITRYNMGDNIETPMYASHFARHSLENALRYHQWKIADWQQTHGDPIPVQSLEDTYTHDEAYRQHHQRLDNRRGTVINTILALLFAWFILLGIITPLTVLRDPTAGQATQMLVLLIGSIVVGVILWRVLIRQLVTQRGAVDEGYESEGATA